MKTDMTLFEEYQIRRIYDEDAEIWWFSVIDIVRVLTQQHDYQAARKYWNKLKQRLASEGSQLVTNCHQLKMPDWNLRRKPAARWLHQTTMCCLATSSETKKQSIKKVNNKAQKLGKPSSKRKVT